MATLFNTPIYLAPDTPVKADKSGRYYYRCMDCLAIAVTEKALDVYYDNRGRAHYAVCGACDGEVDLMGKVSGTMFLRTEDRCPCDGRCTGAKGPQCDCMCGGKNHGTNMLVKVIVQENALPLLAISSVTRGAAEEFRQRCEEAKAAWQALYEDVFTRKRRGEFLFDREFRRFQEGRRDWAILIKAKATLNHKARMKALGNLITSLKGTK